MNKIDHHVVASNTVQVIFLAIGGGARNLYMTEIAKFLCESGVHVSVYYDSEEVDLDQLFRERYGSESVAHRELSGRLHDLNEYLDKAALLQSLISGIDRNSSVVYFGELSQIGEWVNESSCKKIRLFPEPFSRAYNEGPSSITGKLADGAFGSISRRILKYHRRARMFFTFPRQGVFPTINPKGYFSVRKLRMFNKSSVDILLCPEWYYDPLCFREDSRLCVGFVSEKHAVPSADPVHHVPTTIGSLVYLPGRCRADKSKTRRMIEFAGRLVDKKGQKKIDLFDSWDTGSRFKVPDLESAEKSKLAIHSGEIENVARSLRLNLPQVILVNGDQNLDNAFRAQQVGIGVGFDASRGPGREIGVLLQFLASKSFTKDHVNSASSISDHECGLTNAAQFLLERVRSDQFIVAAS